MKLSVHLLLALFTGLVLSVASLAVAAAASAKELKSAQVCGLDEECAPMRDRSGVESITNFSSPSQPPPTAPYFRLDFVYGEPGSPDRNAFSHLYVPSRDLVAAGGEVAGTIVWFPVTSAGLAAIRGATAGLKPFAAPSAWPSSIDDPMFRPSPTSPVAGDARDWTPWLLAAAALLAAAGSGGVLARRLRIRRPKAASS
jgi:hypothetical protein